MNNRLRLFRQTGVVLVVCLIMLLVISIIGITGMKTSITQEKMVGNLRDKNIAFQVAEDTLREGEGDILNSGRVNGLSGMDASCTNGLCYSGQNGIATIWNNSALVANAVSYGTHITEASATTPNSAIANVAAQPRYLIVGSKIKVSGAASIWKYVYQITAIAQGSQSTTQSILNEVYVP